MSIITDSGTIQAYKREMKDCVRMFIPYVSESDLDQVLDYSINKRYKEEDCKISNSYTNKVGKSTLLAMADYIRDREPIVTSFGTMFKRHGTVPNPLFQVVQGFLDKRTEDKNMMFKFPKGSEDYEKYNLLQNLDKIDANGTYGVLGMYTSLVYNSNVATSITSMGRTSVSTMTMFFESFLANNVKFGSVNEVLTFIKNVKKERKNRKYDDRLILDSNVSLADCFAKVVISCGYRWIPDEDELEIIWQTLQNTSQEDLNRIYYKNNLYEFMSNSSMRKAIRVIMSELKTPFLDPNEPPEEVLPFLDELLSILREYVYYRYMYIDRIDRCATMIKSVTLVSDTDSTIVSHDPWYRFVLEDIREMDFPIKKIADNPIFKLKVDEFGDIVDERIKATEPIEVRYDYDFFSDELIELKHTQNPIINLPQDNVRHSIINILGYIATDLVNDYMKAYCFNNNSYREDGNRKCKIIAKNEFLFRRLLLTMTMKSYATLQEVQEGNLVPEDKQLDIKGIASMAKSSMAESTREALKKILYEDILKTPAIDQFRIVKHIAVLEKKIINSLYEGSKEFYKPVTIKAMSTYEDPMRIQGIKAAIVWNALRDEGLPAINLDERNAVDIAKVKINPTTLESIKDEYPEVYAKAGYLLENDPTFKHNIDSIAIPLDVETPEWVLELLNFNEIVNNNIGGFVYESVGIQRFNKTKVNYTNILQL